MRRSLGIVLLCAATVHAEDKNAADGNAAELAYLRAWYQLEVDEDAELAQKAFEKLLQGTQLDDERRVMCRIGLARCRVALGDRAGARKIYAALDQELKRNPALRRKVGEALARLGPPAHSGTFRFHHKQGFNFKSRAVCDGADADVVFASCAGGISSITLAAPGGIMGLERTFGRRKTGLTARLLLDGIAGAFPDRLDLQSTARGDSRTPESDVFILRTRDGGWVKMAIVDRGREGGWADHLATVCYSYNPDRAVFGILPRDAAESKWPVILTRALAPTEEELAAEARKRQRRIAAALEQAAGRGIDADPAKCQEILLARSRFDNYELCTYSFRFGIRDDPDHAKTRNDWDLQFGNGSDIFHVRMVTDDRSTLTPLGELPWSDLAKRDKLEEGAESNAKVVIGHAYLVHTKDRDTDFFTLLRVTGHKLGVACQIEWVSRQEGKWKSSPGLRLTDEEKARLDALLRSLEPGDGPGPPR